MAVQAGGARPNALRANLLKHRTKAALDGKGSGNARTPGTARGADAPSGTQNTKAPANISGLLRLVNQQGGMSKVDPGTQQSLAEVTVRALIHHSDSGATEPDPALTALCNEFFPGKTPEEVISDTIGNLDG